MVKKTSKQNLKSDKSSHEQQLMVLVENLSDQIKLVAEGNLMLGERMDRGFEEMGKRFDSLENRMDSMENRMDSMENRMDSMEGKIDSLEKDMQSSFKTVIEYLSHIEEEIAEIKIEIKRLEEKKADKEVLIAFERRLAKIERELEEHKHLCKNR